MIGNVRADSVLYDLPSAGHGRQLSIETDFIFSAEKTDGCFIAVRPVITNLFGSRKVLVYVTAPEPGSGKKRLFFSTFFPEQLQIFCAWQEKAPLNRTGSAWMKYIPLFFYGFRWNIETSYYEQKTLVAVQLHGKEPERNRTDGKPDQYRILCYENSAISGQKIFKV